MLYVLYAFTEHQFLLLPLAIALAILLWRPATIFLSYLPIIPKYIFDSVLGDNYGAHDERGLGISNKQAGEAIRDAIRPASVERNVWSIAWLAAQILAVAFTIALGVLTTGIYFGVFPESLAGESAGPLQDTEQK